MAKYDLNNPEDRKRLDIDAKREDRKKRLLSQKATKEMLENAKQAAIERFGDDPSNLRSSIAQIEQAMEENTEIINSSLKSSENEVESLEYNKVSQWHIDGYNKRFGDKNATSSYAKAEMGKKKEKRTRKSKAKGDVVENENVQAKTEFTQNKADMKKDSNTKPTAQTVGSQGSFDPKSVPSNVQFDMIPLPSNGECYAHKKGRVPVAYLTAADENLMVSPNLIRDGRVIEMIVKRKILDPDFVFEEMCEGDIEAIVLWLRATAFGDTLPMKLGNPDTGKTYETDIDLSKIKYKPMNLKGDENGEFHYETRGGDDITFRYVNKAMLTDVIRKSRNGSMSAEMENCRYFLGYVKDIYDVYKKNDDDNDDFYDSIDTLKEIFDDVESSYEQDELSENTIITDMIVAQTMSVNGNRDRNFIKSYIEGMLLGDFKNYRKYIKDNEPGPDLNVSVTIPESDGGGSFETFLRVRDTIFLAD